jgi:hypothetical protein
MAAPTSRERSSGLARRRGMPWPTAEMVVRLADLPRHQDGDGGLPVVSGRLDCLLDALGFEASDNKAYGIRGGYTGAERIDLIRALGADVDDSMQPLEPLDVRGGAP